MALLVTSITAGQLGHILDHVQGHKKLNATFDVSADFGAAGDNSTDNTDSFEEALLAAKDAVTEPYGATVVVPPGIYKTGPLVIPNGVNIIGSGMRSTVLSANASGSLLKYELDPDSVSSANYGGRSGHFTISGASLATTGLEVGLCVARTFENIDITGCAGDGVRLKSAQNCHFIEVNSASNTGSGVHLSHGSGGNLFTKCEFNLNGYANGRTSYGGAQSVVNDYPDLNTFVECLFEGTTSTTVACFDHGCGVRTVFVGSHLTLLSGAAGHADLYGTNIPVFWMREDTAGKISTRAVFSAGSGITGSSPSSGVAYKGTGVYGENASGDARGPNVRLDPGCVITHCNIGVEAADSFEIDCDDHKYIHAATVTTRFGNLAGGTATEGTISRHRGSQQNITSTDPATVVRAAYGTLDGTAQTGDLDQLWQNAANKRWSVDATGNAVAWNGYMRSGAGFRSDTRGLVGTPAFAFTNDLDCGMYSPTSNEIAFATAGAKRIHVGSAGELGFFGATPVAKPTVSGAHGSNAALQSLLTALADIGLIVDGSS